MWSDIGRWPEWNPVYLSCEVDDELAEGVQVVLQMRHPRGRPFWTRPRIMSVVPEQELAWTAKGMGLRARTQSQLERHPQGTKLRLASESTGVMAFAYRIAMTKKVQSRLILDTLDAFAAKMAP